MNIVVLQICLTVLLIPVLVVTQRIPHEKCGNNSGVSEISDFEIRDCDRVHDNTTCAFSGGNKYLFFVDLIAAHNCSKVCVEVSVIYKVFEVKLTPYKRCDLCDQTSCAAIDGQLVKLRYIADIPNTSFMMRGVMKPRVVCADDNPNRQPVMACFTYQYRLN